MSNPRSDGQKQILVMMRQEFVDEIDEHVVSLGVARSDFIRQAIYDEMTRGGVDIPASLKSAPSRKGKGGARKKVTSSKGRGSVELKVADVEKDYVVKKKAK